MSDPIQLDRAEFAEPKPAGTRCDVCGNPLLGNYFQINEKMACERCRYQVEEIFAKLGGARGFLRALLAGFGAAVAGSILYYVVREATGYNIALISILVGWGVGRAVQWGARGKGGWAFQTLAVLLTYIAIVSTYIPPILQAIETVYQERVAKAAPQAGGAAQTTPGKAPAKAADASLNAGEVLAVLPDVFVIAAEVPFTNAAAHPLTLLIIAFGLWEAWKANRRTKLTISGPFQVGAAPAPTPSGP